MRDAWIGASVVPTRERRSSKSPENATMLAHSAPAWNPDALDGLVMGTRADASEAESAEAEAGRSAGPVLCSREEMERIGVPLKLTMEEMKKMDKSSLVQDSVRPLCTGSKIEPVYLSAPELEGIPGVKHFALGGEEGPEDTEGVKESSEIMPELEMSPHPGRVAGRTPTGVDPTLDYSDVTEERFNKTFLGSYNESWKEIISESKLNFYCYLWRNHFRMQDRQKDVNKCFVEDLAKKFRRPPTCALGSGMP